MLPQPGAAVGHAVLGMADVSFRPTGAAEAGGVRDPRLFFDQASGSYILFYTAVSGNGSVPLGELSMAVTRDPRDLAGWRRQGTVFPGLGGSVPGACCATLLPPSPNSTARSLLFGSAIGTDGALRYPRPRTPLANRSPSERGMAPSCGAIPPAPLC